MLLPVLCEMCSEREQPGCDQGAEICISPPDPAVGRLPGPEGIPVIRICEQIPQAAWSAARSQASPKPWQPPPLCEPHHLLWQKPGTHLPLLSCFSSSPDPSHHGQPTICLPFLLSCPVLPVRHSGTFMPQGEALSLILASHFPLLWLIRVYHILLPAHLQKGVMCVEFVQSHTQSSPAGDRNTTASDLGKVHISIIINMVAFRFM